MMMTGWASGLMSGLRRLSTQRVGESGAVAAGAGVVLISPVEGALQSKATKSTAQRLRVVVVTHDKPYTGS